MRFHKIWSTRCGIRKLGVWVIVEVTLIKIIHTYQNGLLKFYDFYLYNPSNFLNVQGKISSSKHDFKNLYYRTVRLFKKIYPYN